MYKIKNAVIIHILKAVQNHRWTSNDRVSTKSVCLLVERFCSHFLFNHSLAKIFYGGYVTYCMQYTEG